MDGKRMWRVDGSVDVQEGNTLWASRQVIATGFTNGGLGQLRLRELDQDSLHEHRVRIHAPCENFRREGSLVMCDGRQYVDGDRKLSVYGSHIQIL